MNNLLVSASVCLSHYLAAVAQVLTAMSFPVQNGSIKDNMDLIHLLNDIRSTTGPNTESGRSFPNSMGSEQVFYDEDGLPMDDFLYALKHHQGAVKHAHVDQSAALASTEFSQSKTVGDTDFAALFPNASTASVGSNAGASRRSGDSHPHHSCMTTNSQSSSESGLDRAGEVGKEGDGEDDDSVVSSISDYINRGLADAAVSAVAIKPHIRMQPPPRQAAVEPEKDKKAKPTTASNEKKTNDTEVVAAAVKKKTTKSASNCKPISAGPKKVAKKGPTALQRQQQRQQELAHRMSTEQLHQTHTAGGVADTGDEQHLPLLARNKSLTMRLQGQLQTIRELEYRCLALKSQDEDKELLIKSLHKKIHVLVSQVQAQAAQGNEGGAGAGAGAAGTAAGSSANGFAALKSQLQHAQQKLTEQTAISNQLKDAHGSLLTKHNEAARQHKFQEERYRLLKQYAEKMKTRTQELDACLQTQEDTLQTLQKANRLLKVSSKEHCSDSAALREVLQAKDAEIQQWKYRAEKLQDSLAQTQAHLKQCKAEKRELRADLEAAADRTAQYTQLLERNREERVRQKLQQRMESIGGGVGDGAHGRGRVDVPAAHGYDQPTASWARHTEPPGLRRSHDLTGSADSGVAEDRRPGRASRSASPAPAGEVASGTSQSALVQAPEPARHATRVSRAPFYARGGTGHRGAGGPGEVSSSAVVQAGVVDLAACEGDGAAEPQTESVTLPGRGEDGLGVSGGAAGDSDPASGLKLEESPACAKDSSSDVRTVAHCSSKSGSSASTNTILNSVDTGKRERYNRLKHMYDRIVSSGK